MSPSRCACLVLLVGLLSSPAAALVAHPEALLPAGWDEGISWEVQPVRAPVAPDAVRALAPHVPAATPEVQGPVEVGPGRGAALWLSALEVVRVTGDAGAVQFLRIPRAQPGEASRLALEERGIPAREGLWYLAEPMGSGSVWVVTASRPTRIQVERPTPRRGALVEEGTRTALLAWVEGRGQLPALPFQAALRAQLEVEAELGEALTQGTPPEAPLARAVVAWRKAAALRAWLLQHPLDPATVRLTRLQPPGGAVALEGQEAPFFRPPAEEGTWPLTLSGPGVLALEVRPVVSGGASGPVTVEVLEEGHPVGRLELHPRAARVGGEEAPALPEERRERVLPSGERVGVAEALRIALRPGAHRLAVRWEGGALLLRARLGERRPWLGEVLAGEAHWHDWARRAWALVEADGSAQAALLRRQLRALDPGLGGGRSGPVPGNPLSPLLRALVAVEEAEAGPDTAARIAEAFTALREAGASANTALAWHLRLRLARRLVAFGEVAAAHQLLGRAPSFPGAGWLAAEAAEVVGRLPLGDPLRSRELAALELAWRMEPLSEDIRARYREAWWRSSRWARLSPAHVEGTPAPLRWLDIQALPPGAVPGVGALWPVTAGAEVRVHAPAPAEAPTVLRAYVLPDERAGGPLRLRVGGEVFPLLPVSRVEAVEVALPPGEHALRLEGTGHRAFVTLPPSVRPGAPAEVGYVRTQWPVRTAEGSPVRFRIPDAQLPTPVRLQLRGTGQARGPVALRLHTDVGPTFRVVLHPAPPDPQHLQLDGAGTPGSAPASLVLSLPPLTREVWLVPEEPQAEVVASLSVRRTLEAGGESPGEAPAAAPASERPLEALLAVSRQLRATPGSPELLLTRAELLLSLEEEGLARADVVRVLQSQERLSPSLTRRLLGLLERLAREAPEQVRFPQALTRPTLLWPALPALEGAEAGELPLLAAQARTSGASSALARLAAPRSPAERYLRARLLADAGQVETAARELVQLFLRTGRPQVGLEALALLERLAGTSGGWESGGAPLAYGLAAQLAEWADLPLVRRMRRAGGRWTRWERLRDTEANVGLLEAFQEEVPGAPDADDPVRMALLAPPWALQELRLLTAGRASVLDLSLDRPQRLEAQALCTRPALAAGEEPEPCHFVLRVDGSTVHEAQVPPGRPATLPAGVLAPGPHQLELQLARSGGPGEGVVRFVAVPGDGSEARPLATRRPLSLLRARPGEPVVMTVLGPTALRVSARALGPGAGPRLLLHGAAVREDGAETGDPARARLELPTEADPTLHGTPGPVSLEREALVLLPERGPHRVRLEAQGGEVLVRVRMGVAQAPGAPAPRWWAQAPSGLEPLPWPALPPPLALLPGAAAAQPPPRGAGMLSAELSYRHEDVAEGELLNRPLRTGLEARLGWRQELLPGQLWLRAEPHLRLPQEGTPVPGASLALHARELPLGLRLQLQGGASAQALEGRWRWSARGRAALDRWLPLAPDLALLPSVGLTLEHFQGSAAGAVEPDRYDRSVYWRYGVDHPRRLTPRLTLRWQPFQDQLGALTAAATSNADLATLDHAGAGLRWAALLGGPLPGARAELGYELSWRPEDAHRPVRYLRHGLRGQLDWGLWTGPEGRLLLFAEDQAFLSGPFGLQNVLSVGVRFDWTGGRGLRDVLPYEEEFESLLDPGRSRR